MNVQTGTIRIGKLRKDLQILQSDREAGSENSWNIYDPVTGKYFKIFETDYKIISGLCNDNTPEEYLDYLRNTLKLDVDAARLNSTIGFLKMNGLLMPEYVSTERKVLRTILLKKNMWLSRALSAYLFLRIPIWNPDRFLTRTIDIVRSVFNKWTMIILSLLSLSGYILLLMNWNRFVSTIIDSLTYSGLVRYGIIVIIIKFFHELAHSYTAKSMGVRVRHIGIGLIVFFPRFYTDLTDSWRITDRKKRALIDSAGILLELLTGGLAAIVWAKSTPGIINTIAYYLATTSIINTVLINGNPLIRYDGYYLLSDLFGVDSLQKKSIEFWESVFDRHALGIKSASSGLQKESRRNVIIIASYGITAFFYRLFLYSSIVLIIYFKFTKALGIFLALVEIQLMFIRPILAEAKRVAFVKNKAASKNTIISAVTVMILMIVLFSPLPWSISAPCMIQSKQFSVIYMPFEAFFEKLYINDGSNVEKGQLIAEFKNPFLEWDLSETELLKERTITELDQVKSNQKDIETAKIKVEQIKKQESKITELVHKLKELKVYSPFSGVFYLNDRNLNSRKRMNKGELFGFVKTRASAEVFAYVREEEVNKIVVGDNASVYLNNDLVTCKGIVDAVDRVPIIDWAPSPLLDVYGGPIQVASSGSYIFRPKNRYYLVRIIPDYKDASIPIGRTGIANIRVYRSLAGGILKTVVSSLQKEMTF